MTISTIKKADKKPKVISHIPHKKRRHTVIKPAVNINEGNNEYIIYVAVTGMYRKDFSVTINNKLLTIAAHKNEALHCFSIMEEPVHAEWKESFELPEDADTVMTAAVYRNGELEIHIPRGNADTAGKSVEVFVY